MGLQTLPSKRSSSSGGGDGSYSAGSKSGARPAKQQCTIRVGCEAPDYLSAPPAVSWYRNDPALAPASLDYADSGGYGGVVVEQQRTPSTAYYSANSAGAANAVVAAGGSPTAEFVGHTFSAGSGGEQYVGSVSSGVVPVYQNLTSMTPHDPTDRCFERVCSSPRPYVQYNNIRTEQQQQHPHDPSYYDDQRHNYWTFGYTAQCPKKPAATNNNASAPSAGAQYAKQQQPSESLTKYTQYAQTIQRDENGKSYLELGAKTIPADNIRTWQPQHHNHHHHMQQQQQQQQQHQHVYPAAIVKTCSKCGQVVTRAPQPCYRHQRLSVLSLSMLKLNRYRQCSDPSLHRSVLICNTLRHIEDEMEKEVVVGAPATTPATVTASNNCDTCCCSQCGTALNRLFNGKINEAAAPAPLPPPPLPPPPPPPPLPQAPAPAPPVTSADEEDSGFGDDDSRDIDWSSVLSMTTASDFDVVAAATSSPAAPTINDNYLCDSSNCCDPFASSADDSSWKNPTANSSWSDSDFAALRWKSELSDELEGFVHILVGS